LENWNAGHTLLTLSLSGRAGKKYELVVWNPSQVASVQGGRMGGVQSDQAKLMVEFSAGSADVHQDVVLSFVGAK